MELFILFIIWLFLITNIIFIFIRCVFLISTSKDVLDFKEEYYTKIYYIDWIRTVVFYLLGFFLRYQFNYIFDDMSMTLLLIQRLVAGIDMICLILDENYVYREDEKTRE